MNDDPCYVYPTLYFDTFADSYFLIEILINFVTGFHVNGYYFDSPSLIAKYYMGSLGRFWFDIFTSIPLSYLDLAAQRRRGTSFLTVVPLRTCGEGSALGTENLRLLRILKPLRIIKLLKAMKSIARIKEELETSSPEAIEEFLIVRGADPSSIGDTYMVCFYFVITVFTTVGFGDISASNTAERVFCVFLFLIGASLFGTLLAELNAILQSLNKESREIEEHLEGYISFMADYGVPRSLDKRIREWVRFQFTEEQQEKKKRAVLTDESLPEEFKLALAESMQQGIFSQIPFLRKVLEKVRANFAAELLLKAETKYFAPRVPIADSREPVHSLMIIFKGHVECILPMRSGGSLLRVLKRGDVIGENGIIGDARWAGAWGVEADFIAKSSCSVLFVKLADVKDIVNQIQFISIRRRVEKGAFYWRENQDGMKEVEEEDQEVFKDKLPDQIRSISCSRSKATFNWISQARRLLLSRPDEDVRALELDLPDVDMQTV